jgi:hypothetical protein
MGQVITLVKIPITEIEEWVRSKHSLPSVLGDFRLEDKELILYFREEEIIHDTDSSQLAKSPQRRRRAHRKRNRMRTRGWEAVARITNSKGQKCTIYKPFVEALQKPGLSIEEQKKLVEGILKSNKNKPSETSIAYFLENTLEYLRAEKGEKKE